METKTRVKKILVVALDNLGDAVMATSILRPLKAVCPQASIGLWVKTYTAGLFKDQSMIDRVHGADPFWDKSPGVGKGSFWKFLGSCWDVRRQHYDVAFVLNTEWRRTLATELSRIPDIVGYNRRKSGRMLTLSVPVATGVEHFVDDHRRLVETWSGQGFTSEDCFPRLDLTKAESEWWAAYSAVTGLQEKQFIAIHLFSGDENKNWPLSCWVELMEKLTKAHPLLRFVVVFGPGEDSKLDPYRAHMKKLKVVELGSPSLEGLKAVLSQARLVLGGDSGVGHVAAALGVPVLSLFGDNNPVRSRPVGRGLTSVIQKSPLRQLEVSDVLTRVEELLLRV